MTFDEIHLITQPSPLMHPLKFFGSALLAGALALQAQEPAPTAPIREITLQGAIQMALENNLAVKIQRFGPMIAEFNLKGSYAAYEPSLSLFARKRATSVAGGVDSRGLLTSRESDSEFFGPALSGRLPFGFGYTADGQLSHTIDIARGMTSEDYSGNWNIGISQPLLRGFWIDPDRAAILINKKELKVSEQAFKWQIMLTVNSVEQTYYNLIAARERVKVAEQALELAERTLSDNRKRVEVGALAKLDEKEAESQVASSKAELLADQQALEFRENALKNLLTADYANLHQVDFLPGENLIAVPVTYDLQESWRRGLAMRPDLEQRRLGLDQSEITLRRDRNQLFPDLRISANYGLGAADGSYGNVLGGLGRDKNPSYSYGVSLTIPLGNTAARNRYKIARALKERASLELKQHEQDIMVEIDDAIKAAQTAFQRVQATKEASSFAEVALEAEQKKLENGKSTSFLVLQFQQRLTSARVAEIAALAEYNNALALLAFREGATLERHGLSLNLK